MKIRQPISITDCRSGLRRGGLPLAHRRSQRGIALVITLIMLAVTLVMAVAFLALSQRERGSVTNTTDTKVAQLAAESGLANAVGQMNASMLSGFTTFAIGNVTNGASSNAYNMHLFVSTNYINAYGFTPGSSNPTNVNYTYANGNTLSLADFEQNVSNLWYLPRVPVFVPTNQSQAPRAYDFRYYLDLNQNRSFDPNGWQRVISDDPTHPYYDTNGNLIVTFTAPNVLSNFFVGDPEWVGVLEHPDAPHGPNNHFTSRYAFIAVPVGNTMDLNYIHNQARNLTTTPGANLSLQDGYMRNQGVGSWEINLAAFLADLNTNYWGRFVGSGDSAPPNSATYYQYNQAVNNPNSGYAFQDAFSLLQYRYNFRALPSANFSLTNSFNMFPRDGIDDYSGGHLQTTLDTNEDVLAPVVNTSYAWSGSDNVNHYFTLGDFFDLSKLGSGVNTFVGRMNAASTTNLPGGVQPTYDRYTFYRMLDQLGTDSSPDDGKLNLNYANAVVTYKTVAGFRLPSTIGVVPGAETNQVRWQPLDFFLAASDQMLRMYSSNWYAGNPIAYTNTFAITDPYFTVTNIPVWVSNRFVYTPAVHRLLQLAANIYDAATNGNFNLPHVYKPILERVNNNGDIFIVGYQQVSSVTGTGDAELQTPIDVSQLSRFQLNTPINRTGKLINVYGVPWIIGAKKGLPNFNQLSMVTSAQVSRKVEVTRNGFNPATATYETNQMYVMGITNNVGMAFWNSYSAPYTGRTGQIRIFASDFVNMYLTNAANATYSLVSSRNFVYNNAFNVWPGSVWSGPQPNAALLPASPQQPSGMFATNWVYPFQSPLPYDLASHTFSANGIGVWNSVETYPQLDHFGIAVTNQLQAYILDGNNGNYNVIDYVQLRSPISVGGLNEALADASYPQPGNARLQWSTNAYNPPPVPWGVVNQIIVSEAGPSLAGGMTGGQWDNRIPTPMGDVSPAAEAAYFAGFFKPTFQYNGVTYVNHQLASQAPFTPSRTIFSSYLLQANDPLVHYLADDLNSQQGTWAVWSGKSPYQNGIWSSNDLGVIPIPPVSSVGGRFQPWGGKGQMSTVAGADGNNTYNLAYKDSLVWDSDYWDFPTNLYPTVGWLGRVHRGTPWQSVYLKSTNILENAGLVNGFQTWAAWTGNIQTNIYAYFFDNQNTAPVQDYLLFDIFTTRLNDNAVRGTVPVNVGVGEPDGGLAAWSALFSGMVAISNNVAAPPPSSAFPLSYTNVIIDPAGPNGRNSPLWKIVNDPNFGINATRARTNWTSWSRRQTFMHPGQILETPALSVASPFLNTNAVENGKKTSYQSMFAINDQMYEWLPQQMMGLVRGTEQRYVLYCFGQTLRPAPGGTVLSGPYFQLVTNYQVTAESAIRAVVRVDNANASKPHIEIQSYNVLPPN